MVSAVPGMAASGCIVPRMTAADVPSDFFSRPVADVDPEVAELLESELRRQETTLEMIASENFVPQAVLDCQGSVLTNKYAEGYPGRRYYGGCEYVDVVEELAIARAKEVFGADHVNVQPHAGAQTNAAVYHALIQPGDTIMGMKLDQGGHLSHGMKLNVSGRLYNVVAYGVDPQTSRVNMEEVARVAEEFRPKIIIAGWSAYPRQLDFAAFREVADSVGAVLLVDMAHFAGLVAADEHPSPIPHADVVTTTVHKTLGGARGGMIMCREQYAKKIDSAVFPGQQGGPLMHVIAGKAVALKIAQTEPFRERQQRTRAGASVLAEELLAAGVNVLSGGTDVHLVLVDLRDSELDGKQAEDRLHDIGITVNRNAVPNDPRPPAVSSGLRIGTPALATRGLQVDDFREIGKIIGEALTQDWSDARRSDLSDRVRGFAERYPLYPTLAGTYAGAAAATA
jgi:glycine hydroxymethyltransferase